RPAEMRHPFGMKLHPDPPASVIRLFEGFNHSIRRRGSNLQTRSQFLYRLVMHGQHLTQIWPIECTPPAHGQCQSAVWSRKLDGMCHPVRGGETTPRGIAAQR